MKIFILPPKMVDALRSWFHPKDRSVILAPATFIEGEEIVTPAHPIAPGSPAHNRGRLYWKGGCWTQLDEFGNEQALCPPAWQDWFPTVTQGGAVAATVNRARYVTDGDLVTVQARLTITGTGSGGSVITIENVPAAITPADTTTIAVGSATITDASTPTRYAAVTLAVAAGFRFQTNNQASPIGISPALALASGDVITLQASYERA